MVRQAAVAPPPLAGGTLTVLSRADGAFALASNPETDRIAILHVTYAPPQMGPMGPYGFQSSLQEIMLGRGDEPGRIVEDAAGKAHVVLRRAGAVLTFDPETGTLGERRAVCPAPRGIAYDASSDSLHVVCSTGELVTLPATGGEPTRRIHVDRDLRDVVVLGNRLLVTRFRSAEVLTLDAAGSIVHRATLPTTDGREPHVAWRMTEKLGHVAIAYQLESDAPIDIRQKAVAQASYGGAVMPTTGSGDGGPPVIVAVATTTNGTSFELLDDAGEAAPAFDLALDASGMVVHQGARQFFDGQPQTPLVVHPANRYYSATTAGVALSARQIPGVAFGVVGTNPSPMLFVQTREPAAIEAFVWDGSSFSNVARATISGVSDTGFDLFHTQTPIGIACVSCHPEGGDDGHVWHFITQDIKRRNDPTCVQPGSGTPAPANARRTQSLRGGILQTAPLHWDGDMAGMGDILTDVFSRRMGGGIVTDDQRAVVERWIDSIPRLPLRTDLDAARVDAGRALFEGKGGCSSCHAGAMLTNNATLDVGRGALQVPNLISVGDRAPFLHDGCAKTLADRFDPSCGGSKHGNALDPGETADVIQYLESL